MDFLYPDEAVSGNSGYHERQLYAIDAGACREYNPNKTSQFKITKEETPMSFAYILHCRDGFIAVADRRETILQAGKHQYYDTFQKLFVIPHKKIAIIATGQLTFGPQRKRIGEIVSSCVSTTSEELADEVRVAIQQYGPLEGVTRIWLAEFSCNDESVGIIELEIKPVYDGPNRLGESITQKTAPSVTGSAYYNGEQWALDVFDAVPMPSCLASEACTKVFSMLDAICKLKTVVPYERQTISDNFDMVAVTADRIEWLLRDEAPRQAGS